VPDVNSDPRVSLFRSVPAALGEGAVWHPTRQSLFWVDILERKIFETSLTDATTRTRDVGQLIGAVAPTRAGGLLAALRDGIHRVDLATGATSLFSQPAEHDATSIRFNDAKCDPRGRLFAGTMAIDESPQQGALYRFEPDGTCRRMREQVSVSNGLAWSPDHRTLYYIDSPTRAVQAFDYDPATGDLSRHRIALDLSTTAGFPDGCTIDVEGNLWIAFWQGACVMRWDPVRARLLDTLRLPVGKVTTCTFGGPALDTLFITTAACDLTEAELRAQPEAGFVFAAQVGTRGFPTDTFAG
jgi:sugar lactone lactonase YvrE